LSGLKLRLRWEVNRSSSRGIAGLYCEGEAIPESWFKQLRWKSLAGSEPVLNQRIKN